MKPEIRFHIRETDRRTPVWIGPGKIALLEAIEETGSITSSAKKLGMSYRRAWLLVEETNNCLVRPAVATASGGSHGGGSTLTPVGVELVKRYRALERRTALAVDRNFKALLRTIPARSRATK